MPAYSRDGLNPAAYLERVLSALCRAAGGELRVKGEIVDAINEATTVSFYWDRHTQEVVIRGAKADELLIDIFRVVPENARPTQTPLPKPRIVDPLDNIFQPQPPPAAPDAANPPITFTPSNLNPIDDQQVSVQEKKRAIAMAKAIIRRGLDERKKQEQNG